jgi:hypothetical protein
MARTLKGTPPSYPNKPHNGQGRITVRRINGRRHDLLLGPFGSPENRAEYRRVLTELEAGGGRYRLDGQEAAASGLTVNELCLRSWRHAENHYRLADGSPSRELDHYQSTRAVVVDLYGNTLAVEFGPLKLRPPEVCVMRGRDIDRSGPVWWYRIDPNEVPRARPASSRASARSRRPLGSGPAGARPARTG